MSAHKCSVGMRNLCDVEEKEPFLEKTGIMFGIWISPRSPVFIIFSSNIVEYRLQLISTIRWILYGGQFLMSSWIIINCSHLQTKKYSPTSEKFLLFRFTRASYSTFDSLYPPVRPRQKISINALRGKKMIKETQKKKEAEKVEGKEGGKPQSNVGAQTRPDQTEPDQVKPRIKESACRPF